jgi:hypothetical protein
VHSQRRLGRWELLVIVALAGCGSSGGKASSDGGTGGMTGGGTTGSGTGGTTGGGTGGGSFTTSVPSDTKLSALTPAQQAQICADEEHYLSEGTFFSNFCRIIALQTLSGALNEPLTDAQLQAGCASDYTGCLSADGGVTGSGTTCNLSNVGSQCMGSVGDYLACSNDDIAKINQLAASLPSCSTITMSTLATAAAAIQGDAGFNTSPASCAPIDGCNTG